MAEENIIEQLAIERVTLDIRHNFPDNIGLTFADNVAVQHTHSEFTITFAQTFQPIIFNEEEYKKLTEIRADVVARIVLTPPKMLELIQALQTNWQHYERRIKMLMEEKAQRESNATSTASSEGPNTISND